MFTWLVHLFGECYSLDICSMCLWTQDQNVVESCMLTYFFFDVRWHDFCKYFQSKMKTTQIFPFLATTATGLHSPEFPWVAYHYTTIFNFQSSLRGNPDQNNQHFGHIWGHYVVKLGFLRLNFVHSAWLLFKGVKVELVILYFYDLDVFDTFAFHCAWW